MGLYEINKKYKVGANDFTHKRQLYCVKKILNLAASLRPITSVLDCPCGSGRFSGLFEKYKLTCGDISDTRIETAKDLIHKDDVKFAHCDLLDMPFKDFSFDLILCAFVLQHIQKEMLPRLFSELARVTKSWVLLTYNTNFALLSFRRIGKDGKTKLTHDEFNTLCNEAGFTIVKEMSTFPFLAATKVVLLQKSAI
jgi:ubiquinone/menaquinone biosynthesis C-methylase UbiE